MEDVVHCAFLSIGSNVGDPLINCQSAIERLSGTAGIQLEKRSSFYKTTPWGKTDQPSFINAVVEIRTKLNPVDLLSICQSIEHQMGRVRKERWGPRIIDLDILLFDKFIISKPELEIPHPFLHQRRFVLVPLCEFGSDLVHPRMKKTMGQLLVCLSPDAKRKNSDDVSRINDVCLGVDRPL